MNIVGLLKRYYAALDCVDPLAPSTGWSNGRERRMARDCVAAVLLAPKVYAYELPDFLWIRKHWSVR